MVHEDEPIPGPAPLERLLEPVVLCLAQRPLPGVIERVWICRGVPERIQHDEKRVTPFPSVIVLEQPQCAPRVIHRLRIPAVERPRGWRRVIGLARLQVPRRNVVLLVRGRVENVAVLRLVVAQHVKVRHRVAHQLKVIPENRRPQVHTGLVRNTPAVLGRHTNDGVSHLVRHENVPKVDVEVWPVRQNVPHRTRQKPRIRVEVQMRIGRHGELESAALRTCRPETALPTGHIRSRAGQPVAKPIIVLRVGRQTTQCNPQGTGGCGIHGGHRGARVHPGLGAVFHVGFDIHGGSHRQRHTGVRRQRQKLRIHQIRVGQRARDHVARTGRWHRGRSPQAVGGRHPVVHRRATRLGRNLGSIHAIPSRPIPVETVIEHRHQDRHGRRRGEHHNVVHIHLGRAQRRRCCVPGKLEPQLQIRPQLGPGKVIPVFFEVMVDAGRRGRHWRLRGIQIERRACHKIRGAGHRRHRHSTRETARSQRRGSAGCSRVRAERHRHIRLHREDPRPVRDSCPLNKHPCGEPGGGGRCNHCVSAGHAAGKEDQRPAQSLSSSEARRAGACHRGRSQRVTRGIQNHVAEVHGGTVPGFRDPCVPRCSAIGRGLEHPAVVVARRHVPGLDVKLHVSPGTGRVDRT